MKISLPTSENADIKILTIFCDELVTGAVRRMITFLFFGKLAVFIFFKTAGWLDAEEKPNS